MKSVVHALLPLAAVVFTLIAAVSAGPPLHAQSTALHPALTASEVGGFGFGSYVAASHPEGGWLLVGNSGEDGRRLRAVRVFADGTLGEAVTTPTLDQIEVGPLAVAVGQDGRWLAAWFPGQTYDFMWSSMEAALFAPDGGLVRDVDLSVPGEDPPAEPRQAVAGTAPNGDFVVAWGARTEETVAGDDALFVADLFAARFTAAGQPVVGPVLINETRVGHQQPFGLVIEEESIVVAWSSWCCNGQGWDVRARALAPDLSPQSAEVRVADGEHSQSGSALAGRPGGGFVVVWEDWRGSSTNTVMRLRHFREDGTADSPETLLLPREAEVAASPAGVVWSSWIDDAGEVVVRPFNLEGMPLDGPRPTGIKLTVHGWAFDLGVDDQGRLLVVGQQMPVSDPVQLAAIQRTTPPPEHVLTSPEVPGFRVWVLITPPDQGAEPIWGAEEPLCIPETLCVSGAVPGRTEALVRIVGPKPNGFLWPTLVKLSTSRVEVWIEQEATGELQHYLLPGASPGDDTLRGLFDRFGFLPF